MTIDTVMSGYDNMWYCFYCNKSQLMGLRFSSVLKLNLVQTSNSIQSYYHTIDYALIGTALDLVRNPSVLVFMDYISPQL